VDVDLIGWVGVWLGGTYGCRCGILYAPMLGVVFYAGLVSLTSSSYPSPCSLYSSELIGGGFFWWSASRVLLCVRVRRNSAFVFCGRENRSVKCGQFSHILQLCFLTEFTSPYSLNTQRGWHTSEVRLVINLIRCVCGSFNNRSFLCLAH